MNHIPFVQAYQTRVLAGAVSAGTSTLNYYFDTKSGETPVHPVLGASNVNPNIAYVAPSDAMETYDHQNDGFDSVTVNVFIDDVTTGAVVTVALYECDDISGTNARLIDDVSYATATLTPDALTATTDADKIIILDVVRATGRFFNVRITRATQNSALNGVWVVLGNPKRIPVQKHSTVYAQKVAYES